MSATPRDWSVQRWAHAKVVEIFGADLRSLAVFRGVLAVLVLADLANRARDLTAHYTDEGILPRTALLGEVLNRWSFSLNLMNGEPFFQILVFGVTALAALGMLVGYRTRLMTAIVWIAMLSIMWRNPLVSSGGDTLLVLLLFWGMFLPLGAHWSVDRMFETEPPRLAMSFLSLATFALFMQIAFVYWFSVVLKSSPEWRTDGTALYYALNLDRIATPLGAYLAHFPTLLKVLTLGTVGLETLGPLLLFCPFFTRFVRTGTVLVFMSFHLGIWLTMHLGMINWVSGFCMVCFLPGWFWDVPVAKVRAALPERFETVRQLKHLLLNLAHHRVSPLRMRLVPAGAEQPQGAGLATQDDHNEIRRGSAHFTTFRSALTGRTPQRGALVSGRGTPTNDPPEGTGPPMLRSSLVTNLLAFFFLLYILCWNLVTVSALTMPVWTTPLGPFLGLQQQWNMFAPYPPTNDGWYVIPGTLRGGQHVDLRPVIGDDFRLHNLSWEKPRYVLGTYEDEHWRKYLENILSPQYTNERWYFGNYICREWNAHHAGAEQLTSLRIIFMQETTLPDYRHSDPQKLTIWKGNCS
ncbi:MAG: HTTM domain-containing protein [Actinomycetota bacterium]|nr:HTTM domain-containing protein [Actinomycetota bacterium]